MATFAGILAQVAEKGTAYQRREFDPKSIMAVADRAAREFQRENMNLLSCYELEGPFSLHQTLGQFCKTNNPAGPKIEAAIEDGDEQALFAAFLYAMRFAFTTLYQRNALKRLQLVEKWPEEAQKEYSWMCGTVSAATASAPAQPTSVVPAAPVETPTEICAREFRELSSGAWKQKWLDNQHNRAVADRCAAEGRL